MTTERGSRRRRGHAAIGGRVLIGGLSASVLVGLIGAMARAERPAAADQPAPVVTRPTAPATPPPSSTQLPTANGATPAPPVTTRAAPEVQVTRPTTPPTTTSHAT